MSGSKLSTGAGVARTPARRGGAGAIETRDFRIPGGAPGVELFVRNKKQQPRRAPGPKAGVHAPPVVFVHGATYPGSVMIDSPMFGGPSWLEDTAAHGFDAWMFDIRGYGRSSRPEPARDAAGRELPIARTCDAIEDLQAVVDFVRARTGARQVDLIGWSWGANIAGGFAATRVDEVRRLVLLGPVWLTPGDPATMLSRWMMAASPFSMGIAPPNLFGAYRSVTRQYARERWVRGLDAALAERVLPWREFEGWWRAMTALDPQGAGPPPHVVRAPNGVLNDAAEFWAVGRPTYRPQDIEAPVLLLVAEWDVDTPPAMVQALFAQLEAARYKRLEILARGTHCIALELNREEVFARTREFLAQRLR